MKAYACSSEVVSSTCKKMLRVVKSGDWAPSPDSWVKIRSVVLKELDQQKHDHSELASGKRCCQINDCVELAELGNHPLVVFTERTMSHQNSYNYQTYTGHNMKSRTLLTTRR